jgi:hypothetical protein
VYVVLVLLVFCLKREKALPVFKKAGAFVSRRSFEDLRNQYPGTSPGTVQYRMQLSMSDVRMTFLSQIHQLKTKNNKPQQS